MGAGENTVFRVHRRCTRLQHTAAGSTAHHSLVAVAAVGCCPATRCQVHQRSPRWPPMQRSRRGKPLRCGLLLFVTAVTLSPGLSR